MNVLLLYPEVPETYWSFKYALPFQGKRAAQPPLGLMTVSALLPEHWSKRLIDANVERVKEADLAWADVAMVSGMHVQRRQVVDILERCRGRGLRTVVGGPITSSISPEELRADHVVIGEAEDIVPTLARDLEDGTARPVYQAEQKPILERSPLPDLNLIKMRRYSTMTLQSSRGCPFNCEFCDIIEIYGRRPRTKSVMQVLAEMEQLHAAGWRGAVFVVDDNFIGNRKRAKEVLAAMAGWNTARGNPFRFITEASLDLADDAELLTLMKKAGFSSVFLGIESPEEQSLLANHKLQNTRRDLLKSVEAIQEAGIEVMGGFILGFDTDTDDVFDRTVEFIQKSAIPVAMVGLLQAMPGTQLFRRLRSEGRIVDSGDGNNTDCALNFLPRMNATRLVEGYRSVLRRIYDSEPYYRRVKLFLERCQPRRKQPLGYSSIRALVTSIVRQGLLGRARMSYWRLLLTAATRYRHSFDSAVTLAVMGHHFQVITAKICVEKPLRAAELR